MTFSFNSKASYLSYRDEWTAQYFVLIKAVRTQKQAVKDAMRDHAKGKAPIHGIWDAMRARSSAASDVQNHLTELWAARSEAGRQMALARK